MPDPDAGQPGLQSKPRLRAQCRALGDRHLTVNSIKTGSNAISERLSALLDRTAPAHLQFFERSGNEPDVSGLRTAQATCARNCYLPRMDWPANEFHAALAAPGAELALGRFGLREPPPDAPTIAPDRLHAIVIPGVAFDVTGARLGRGGGHYDRFLTAAGDRPLRIGVCFDQFLLGGEPARALGLPERIPTEPHDQSMHVIITPTRTIRLRAG